MVVWASFACLCLRLHYYIVYIINCIYIHIYIYIYIIYRCIQPVVLLPKILMSMLSPVPASKSLSSQACCEHSSHSVRPATTSHRIPKMPMIMVMMMMMVVVVMVMVMVMMMMMLVVVVVEFLVVDMIAVYILIWS